MTDFKNQSTRRPGAHAPAFLAALVATALLSACGGGGGSPGTTAIGGATGSTGSTGTTTGSTGSTGTTTGSTGSTAPAASPTVGVSLVNANGATTNTLSSTAPLTVKATVLDASKKPVPNAIVTFTTDGTLAVFSPSAGTALTDANGVASINMRPANLSAGGAGTVSATSSVAGANVSGASNYAVGATTLTFGTLGAAPASLQAYGSTTLSVDLMSGTGKYTDQSVDVSFSSSCVAAGKATLASTVPTVNGTAQTVYRDKGCGQNDIVTVSANAVSKAVNTTLTIAPPAAASVQFVSAAPADQSIVIKGQGGNGRTETATLTFKVVDVFGNPLAGKSVSFTKVPAGADVTVNKASDTTDASGTVITTVNSGNTATSFRVQASLPGTGSNGGADISTLSDSVVVTTGQPVQRAMSISTGSFNVEGWTVDSSPTTPATHIQVLLADASGNPVPDGTPIVFQTNMGSVGSASKGGCNTTNGGCSVDFRTQNPRLPTANTPSTPCNTGSAAGVSSDSTRIGLSTVCASTSDGTNTLFSKIALFFSGSDAVKTRVNGLPVTVNGAPNDLGTQSASGTQMLVMQLNDINNNPMPLGTKIAFTDLHNVTLSPVVPDSVPNIVPHTATADDTTGTSLNDNNYAQGSFHTFSVTGALTGACVAGTAASFTVLATTPNGTVTNIPFKLSLSCP